MNEDAIVERIRADADQLDSGQTDINALVDGAVFRGRRQRTRRRLAGAVAGAVAAVVAIALIGALPTGWLSAPRAVPAGPAPTVATSSSPARTHTPTPPASPEQVSGTPLEVQKTLEELLPASSTVTHASHALDLGSDGFPWENSTALTVHDARGTSYIFGAIGNGPYTDGCFNTADCTKSSLPDGGVLWIFRGPAGDKSGVDLTFNYNRPRGGHIQIMELNYATGNGPVTRDKLLLTKTEGSRVVTSPVWDALFHG